MPPKMVVCSICNKEVLKAQTYALPDGSRACKTHEGVSEQAIQLHEKKLAEEHRKRTKPKKKPWENSTGDQEFFQSEMTKAREFRDWAHTHCWVCNQEGISLRDYFAQSIVAAKRLELRGEFNLLSAPKDIHKMIGLDVKILAMVSYDDIKDRHIYKEITKKQVKDIIHILRCINVCTECAKKLNIYDRIEALLPKPSWDQIQAMVPVMALVDPVITKIAEKKEREN